MNTSLVLVNAENPTMSTIVATTQEAKVKAYNALENPTGDVMELVNREFNLTDLHMSHDTCVNESGETYDRITTTILLDDGTSYRTTYKSFAKSLVKFLSVFGMPDTWDNHKALVSVQVIKYQGGLHDGLRLVAK